MNYDELIKSEPAVLVEFYATWCPHCRRMMPVVAQIQELLAGKLTIYPLDIDENQEVADDENVQSTPTFLMYKNGKLQWRQVGEMEAEVLLDKIQAAL